jgi:hypothetical protein
MGHSSCPSCGAAIDGGSKTCASCGAVYIFDGYAFKTLTIADGRKLLQSCPN